MASITQTIPQYSLGMSEQPDQLKFPGQVTEVTNAIPDLTKGLFKRPGAKRIGTDKLANVQSGGSWFHYFRQDGLERAAKNELLEKPDRESCSQCGEKNRCNRLFRFTRDIPTATHIEPTKEE